MDHDEHEARTKDLLAEVSPERGEDLLHLLECPLCRGSAAELVRHPWERGGSLPGGLPGEAPEARHEEAAAARRLAERLLASPPSERPALARSEGFRNLPLAELLTAQSRAAQPADPERSEALARLALLVAGRLQAASPGRVDSVKALAHTLAANARRLLRDRQGAEDLFRAAAFHLTGPPDARERATYCQALALLRLEQGRSDEAAGLLWRAAALFKAKGERAAEASCLARLGLAILDGGEPERAVPPLARAAAGLDPLRTPELAVRVRLGLALCNAALGRAATALRLVEEARPLFGLVLDGHEVAVSSWLLGRIFALTDVTGEAAELLELARARFLADQRLHDTALVTIDLAQLFAETRQTDRLHLLVHELIERFPASLETAGVLRAVAGFVSFAERRDADLDAAAAMVCDHLRRARRAALPATEPGLEIALAPGPEEPVV